jgi:hypothetical protein
VLPSFSPTKDVKEGEPNTSLHTLRECTWEQMIVLQICVPRRRQGKIDLQNVIFSKIDESGRSIPIVKSLVEEENPFSFYDGYQKPTTFNYLET